ncbi:hypothetical protein DF3PB_3380004 [uncultured Defluviicoccus sp.]|uniref:Uncharacterized protein n=1 Tax=metagenome TaxID=256318 RepID=A0A380TEF9_9ZZZZ|nr:hypothetical protein DF3PB_3380004 [uncultured Defluviicoccus sp.]
MFARDRNDAKFPGSGAAQAFTPGFAFGCGPPTTAASYQFRRFGLCGRYVRFAAESAKIP